MPSPPPDTPKVDPPSADPLDSPSLPSGLRSLHAALLLLNRDPACNSARIESFSSTIARLVVQQVAVCYWWLCRTLRAESQEWGQVFAAQHEPPTSVELYWETTIIPRPTLPPPDRVETLLLYEKSIQSQLTRSLTHLGRLQRQRREQATDTTETLNAPNEPIPPSPSRPRF